MEITTQEEYKRLSILHLNLDTLIKDRKVLRYNELERLIKQFNGLFSLECTDRNYYILYDANWKVKGNTLYLTTIDFIKYIEDELNKYKGKTNEIDNRTL